MSKLNESTGRLAIAPGAKSHGGTERRWQAKRKTIAHTPITTAQELLRIVRAAQPIPRVAVARRLGVHRRRITVLVKPLLDSGVLREATPEPTGVRAVGRPPIGLALRTEADFLIGVNLGVSLTQVGAGDANGNIISEESFPTLPEPTLTLAQLRTSIEKQSAGIHDRRLAAIGISVPGPTDIENGRLLYAPHLGWRDVPIAEMLRVKIPVLVENNATAAAVYEAQRRRARSLNRTSGDFVLVRAGTGIGVGLVREGEMYRGTDKVDLAGEFGHMTIVAGGKSCPCGNFGCWERYASAASAVELYKGNSPRVTLRSSLRFTDVVARAFAGERRAQVTLERVGTHLGIGIGNVICGVGIPQVVVSGELVHGWKFIEGPARAAIGMSMAGRLSDWSLVPGDSHGAELGGALEVAIEHYLISLLSKKRKAAA